MYAAKRKLTALQPTAEDESTWPCFECPLRFTSSDELQKHLNVHDENKVNICTILTNLSDSLHLINPLYYHAVSLDIVTNYL